MTPNRPIPELCDACASADITFKRLRHRVDSVWPWGWVCNACRASTACHDRTNIPLGIMCSKEHSRLRGDAHAAFDPLWQSGLMTREKAYRWLAAQLGISEDSAHIGWMTQGQLNDVIRVSVEYHRNNVHKAAKKIQQRRDRQTKAIENEKRQRSARRDECRRFRQSRRT